MNKEKLFIYVGRIEALSLLILMGIAMPMKYLMDQPEMVKHVGRAHGGLFLLYVVMAAAMADSQNWPRKKLMMSWLLSCVPFGTFIFEKKYMQVSPTA
jgi:integral membrane protein